MSLNPAEKPVRPIAGSLAEATVRPIGVTRRALVGAGAACAAATGVAAVVPWGAPGPARAAEAPADEVVVFHTNDMHGALQGNGSSVVGIDYVAALKKSVPGALLLDAGDATQGMPLATLEKGASVITLMNSAGYDAMCLGNHEFDFGLEQLRANVEAAAFPVLGANVLAADGGLLLEGVVNAAGQTLDGALAVLEAAGRRIGVFGVLTRATSISVMPSIVADLAFADEVATAEACIAELDARGVDAIVCLAHIGGADTMSCTARDLARTLSPEAAGRLCAIIDGHSHEVENELVNGILVVQTGCNLAAVGRLVLAFAVDGTVEAREELLDPGACAALVEPDAEVANDLAAVGEAENALLAKGFIENPTTLWAGWLSDSAVCAPTRAVETNFGDVVAAAMVARGRSCLQAAGLDDGTPLVGAANGGGIRAALPRGTVTMGNLLTAFPFSNTVVAKRITPAELREALELSLVAMDGQDAQTGMLLQDAVWGGFLQLAGCTATYDPNAPQGSRVVSIVLDGAEEPLDLDDDRTPLVMVANSYVMSGGDGAEVLGRAAQLAEVGGELEAVEDYLLELASGATAASGLPQLPVLAGTAGNILMRGGYEPADWTATVRLVDADGKPLAGCACTLEVDAAERFDVESDANGLVYLPVSDGPHAVCAAPETPNDPVAEVYVDNYTGIGLVEDDLRTYPVLTVPRASRPGL